MFLIFKECTERNPQSLLRASDWGGPRGRFCKGLRKGCGWKAGHATVGCDYRNLECVFESKDGKRVWGYG